MPHSRRNEIRSSDCRQPCIFYAAILQEASRDQIADHYIVDMPQMHCALAFSKLANNGRTLDLFCRYEAILRREYDRAYAQLKELQKDRREREQNPISLEGDDSDAHFPPEPIAPETKQTDPDEAGSAGDLVAGSLTAPPHDHDPATKQTEPNTPPPEPLFRKVWNPLQASHRPLAAAFTPSLCYKGLKSNSFYSLGFLVNPSTRAAVFLLLSSFLAIAQQPDASAEGRLKGLSLEQLGNIEVTTVSKTPVAVSRTPAAIYVITQEDIRRSGARSVPEVLRLAPGVEVAQIDSVKWAIGIRGFESRLSRAVLVLIDGRSVYSPLFHGVYWEVQDTLLRDIERIEVIRGPGGTIWGANAVDGVINIITKKARDTKGTLAYLGGGSLEHGLGAFRYGGGNDSFNYRFYVKGTEQGPQFHFDNRNFDDWRRVQAGFRSDWDINPRDSLTVQGDIYTGSAGESVRLTYLNPPSLQIADQNAQLSGGNVLLRWNRMLSGTSDIQLQGYYDRVNRLQANQAEYRNTFDIDFVHHFALGERNSVIYGVEVRESPAHLPATVPTYVFTPNERTDQVYTAYVQDTVQIVNDRLSFTVGTKLLHSSFTGFDAEPSGRIIWTPTTRQSLWAGVTRAVRTPSDIEDTLQNTALISSSPPAVTRTQGDGRFTSETLIGYELGYRALVSRTVSLDLATFYNRYDHLLSLEPGTPYSEIDGGSSVTVYPYINGNGIRGTTKGFEITPDWKPTGWWRLQASVSFLTMDMEDSRTSRDLATASTLTHSSPRLQGRIQSFFDIGKSFEISTTWRYVSDIPFYLVGAYQTGDARFAWRLHKNVEFAVTGQNLLQPHHAEYGGDPGPLVGIRRNIFASLTFRK